MQTITVPGWSHDTGSKFTFHLHTNYTERELITFDELTPDEQGWLDYVPNDEHDSPRFFRYLGDAYDLHEFEVAPSWLKAQGFDGWQTNSAFSATVVRYFDADGYELEGVIVGRIHW